MVGSVTPPCVERADPAEVAYLNSAQPGVFMPTLPLVRVYR